jgi:3-hydroxyacyl-[acyl-carrier-protein] dehydratase
MKAGIFKFTGVTRVQGNIVCQAELMCTMRSIG